MTIDEDKHSESLNTSGTLYIVHYWEVDDVWPVFRIEGEGLWVLLKAYDTFEDALSFATKQTEFHITEKAYHKHSENTIPKKNSIKPSILKRITSCISQEYKKIRL